MNYKENHLLNKFMKDISFFKTFGKFIGLLLLMELLVYRDFIFGNKLLIFKDLGSDSYNGN